MSKKTVTVVTGGASGIGAACVKHHVQRGDEVIVLDLPGTWSDAKTKETGVKAFYPCDVLQDQTVHDAAKLIEKNHGPKFWQKVKCMCPDFATHRLWLKQHGRELTL